MSEWWTEERIKQADELAEHLSESIFDDASIGELHAWHTNGYMTICVSNKDVCAPTRYYDATELGDEDDVEGLTLEKVNKIFEETHELVREKDGDSR